MSAGLEAFGGAVLLLHAHPDDESISTGGTIAALRRAGARVMVLTATRGERGEIMEGDLTALEGTPALVPVREAELAAALRELGDPTGAFLGTPPARKERSSPRTYADSGMTWGADGLAAPAADSGPLALTRARFDEALLDVTAAVERFQPTCVIGYDERGGYGHPDHRRCHELARVAAWRRRIPFFAIVEPRVGTPVVAPDQPDVVVPLGQDLLAKVRAMRAHRTQLRVDGDVFTLTGGQTHPIGREEAYRRLG